MDREDLEILLNRELTYKELERLEVGKSLYDRSIEVIYNTFGSDYSDKIMDAIRDDQLFI